MDEFLIRLVRDERAARAEFDRVGPKLPFFAMLKRWAWARQKWLLLWSSALLVVRPSHPGRLALLLSAVCAARWGLWFYRTRVTWATNQYDQASDIRSEKWYQDPALLKRAWQEAGPAARALQRRVQSVDGAKNLVFQPKEGWCGYASLNCALASIDDGLPLLHYEAGGRHISLSEMSRLVAGALAASAELRRAVTGFEVFSARDMSRTEFRRHVVDRARLPQYRYLMIYHRAPLFFNEFAPGVARRHGIQQMLAAHWSPVLGSIQAADDAGGDDLVFVGDVNEKYGAWLCPVDRLYDSVANRSFLDHGEWRGLLRLRVAGTPSTDPLPLAPEEAVDRFVANKGAYYQWVARSSRDGYVRADESGPLFNAYCHDGPCPFFKLIVGKRGQCESATAAEAELRRLLVPFAAAGSFAQVLLPSMEPTRSVVAQACVHMGMLPVASPSLPPHSIMCVSLVEGAGAEQLREEPAVHDEYVVRELLPGQADESLFRQLTRCVCVAYPFFKYFGELPDLTQCFEHFFHPDMPFGPDEALRILVAEHRESGKLAGSVVVFVAPGETVVGSMYNVTVLPEHARRGLGKALTLSALRALRHSGCSVCVLEASPYGRPLYVKLHFTPAPNHTSFIKAGFVRWRWLGPLLRLAERYVALTGGMSPLPLANLAMMALLVYASR